jgi:hypothetical protein
VIECDDKPEWQSEAVRERTTSTLLEQNHDFQEACEERWNSVLLTTN